VYSVSLVELRDEGYPPNFVKIAGGETSFDSPAGSGGTSPTTVGTWDQVTDKPGGLLAKGGGDDGYSETIAASTLGGIEVIQLDASSGNVTETLPAPEDGAQVLYIRVDDTAANTVTIEDPGGGDIYIFAETNAPTYDLSTRERVFLVSDGTSWYVEDFRGGSSGGVSSADGILAQGGGADGITSTVEAETLNLTDVKDSGRSDGKALKYVGANSQYEPVDYKITGLEDVDGATQIDGAVVRYDAGTSTHEYVEYVLGALNNVTTSGREDADIIKYDAGNDEYTHQSLSDAIGEDVDVGDFNDIVVGGRFLVRVDGPPTSFTRTEQINQYDSKYGGKNITELIDNSIWIDDKPDNPPSIPYLYDKDNDVWEKKEGGFFDGGLILANTIEANQIRTNTIAAETGFFNDTAIGGLLTIRSDTAPTGADYNNKYPSVEKNEIPNNAIWIDTSGDTPNPKKYDKENGVWESIGVAIFDGSIIAEQSIETAKVDTKTIKAEQGFFNNIAIGGGLLTVRKSSPPTASDYDSKYGSQNDNITSIPNNAIWIDTSVDPIDKYKYDADDGKFKSLGIAILDGGLLAANSIESEQINADAITTDLLDADAVKAENIQAGAITADTIDSNAVYSDKFASVGGDNEVTQPDFRGGEGNPNDLGWDGVTALKKGNLPTQTLTDGSPAPVVGVVDRNQEDEGISHALWNRNFAEGVKYLIKAQVASDSNAGNDIEIGLAFYGPSIQNIGWVDGSYTVSPTNGTWSLFTAEVGPLNRGFASKIALGVRVKSADAGNWYIATPSVQNMSNSTVIEGGSITTVELDAEAVTSNKIKAGTITAGDISAETITAGEIKAGSVTSDRFVSRGSGLLRNTGFRGPNDGASEAEWSGITAVSASASEVPDSNNAPTDNVGRVDGATSNPSAPIQDYPTARGLALSISAADDGASDDLKVGLAFQNDDGTEDFVPALTVTPPSTWSQRSTVVDVPNVSDGRPFLLRVKPVSGQSGNWYIANPSLERQVNETLIEGASVSTGALQASSVTAAKIKGDTITANEIQANAITSDQIASGTITGGEIDATTSIEVGANNPKILIDGSSPSIESSNFAAGVEGFRVTPETAEFGDIKARGEFEVVAFTKESVNAVGGGLAVAESTTLADTAQSGDTTLYVRAQVFEAGDDVRLKDANADDVRTVSSVNNSPSTGEQAITLGSGVSQTWGKGTAILKWNAERIFLDASNDENTPSQSVVNSANTETVRLGNLNGKSGISGSGIYAERGLFTEDVIVGGRSLTADSFATPIQEVWHFDSGLTGALEGTNPVGLEASTRTDFGLVSDGGTDLVATLRPDGQYGGAVAVEAGTTNVLTSPFDFSDQAWNKNDLPVTTNAAKGPYNDGTADLLTPTAVNGSVYQDYSVDPNGKTFTFSVWLRADKEHGAAIKLQDNDNSQSNFKTINVGTEWQRYEVTHTFTSSATEVKSLIWPGDFNGTTDPVYAWGAQIEQKETATSVVDGTRASGVLSYDVNLNADSWAVSGYFPLRDEDSRESLWQYAVDGDNILDVRWKKFSGESSIVVELTEAGSSETRIFSTDPQFSVGETFPEGAHVTVRKDSSGVDVVINGKVLDSSQSAFTNSFPSSSGALLFFPSSTIPYVDELVVWGAYPTTPELEKLIGSGVALSETPQRTTLNGEQIRTGTIRSVATDLNGNPFSRINLNDGSVSLAGGDFRYDPNADQLTVEGQGVFDTGQIANFNISQNRISSQKLEINSEKERIQFVDPSAPGSIEFSSDAFVDYRFTTGDDELGDSWTWTPEESGASNGVFEVDEDSDSTIDYVYLAEISDATYNLDIRSSSSRDLSSKSGDDVTLRVTYTTEGYTKIELKVYDMVGGESLHFSDTVTPDLEDSELQNQAQFQFTLPADASQIEFEFATEILGVAPDVPSKIQIDELRIYEQFPLVAVTAEGVLVQNENGDLIDLDVNTGRISAKQLFATEGVGFWGSTPPNSQPNINATTSEIHQVLQDYGLIV
jgi:hypothetical protein